MSEISKAYEPQSVESKWYQFWLDRNCFTADPARVSETRPAYSIVIPPPNVTGVLTLGHVLNNPIQDILAGSRNSIVALIPAVFCKDEPSPLV
jgi:valyl-tRNA synthetase